MGTADRMHPIATVAAKLTKEQRLAQARDYAK